LLSSLSSLYRYRLFPSRFIPGEKPSNEPNYNFANQNVDLKFMKKAVFLIFLSLVVCKNFAQNKIANYEIGTFFDLNNQPINGYFDLDYEPEKSLKVDYVIGDDFTPGYYYDIQNRKISGVLKYLQTNTYFEFKEDQYSRARTIEPTECNGYVIGVDSFAVIQNFFVEREIGSFKSDKKEFAEVIEKFGKYIFYKHTRIGVNNNVTTYLYRIDSSETYISFPKKTSKFNTTAIPVFKDFALIVDKINSGKYGAEDIPVMVKFLKYKYKFDKQENIYYSSSWDEVDNANKSKYYAEIKTITDSIFHLSFFFNNKTLIYEGDFTSFFPNRKVGDFIWYYPNGGIRKKVNYQAYKPTNTTTYFKNGNIHLKYTKFDDSPYYSKVLDINGDNLLNSEGSGKEVYYDSIAGRELNIEYLNHSIVNSYFIDSNNRKVYQTCSKNAKPQKFDWLQAKIDETKIYPINSVAKFNHGFALVKCIIEPSGLPSGFQIIKSNDKECDLAIINFLYANKALFKWKPAKVGKEAVPQEVILPIEFSIQGFSRYRSNYNDFWMMQHMMNMQMMQPRIPPMSIPRM
jgi:hypothetical protein